MTTRRITLLHRAATIVAAGACLTTAARAMADEERGEAVLEFQTMATVQGALVGARTPFLRDQAAGGLPWVIRSGHGVLHADGRLVVQVRGLVLADDPAVPPALRLTNPIPTFRAVVSCVRKDGTAVTSETPAVSAGTDGDAHIEAHVDPPLPQPCIAPIVFVGNGAKEQQDVAWFAAIGLN